MIELKELTAQVGIPVCIRADENDLELPEGENTVFVVSKKGFMKVVKTRGIMAVLPMDTLPGLKEVEPDIKWLGPKLPIRDLLFLKNVMFDFARKSNKNNELAIHIFHSELSGWWYGIPYQKVSPVSCDWDTDKGYVWIHDYVKNDSPPSDIIKVGNIHSHHSMLPEWSEKDDNMQVTTEFGMQFVVGWMNKGFGVQCRLVMDGKVTDVPMEEVVDIGERLTFNVPDEIIDNSVTSGRKAYRKKKKSESDIEIEDAEEEEPELAPTKKEKGIIDGFFDLWGKTGVML